MTIFLTLDLFLSPTPKGWEESVAFLDAELYAKSFEKNSFKKSNILEAHQTLKILGVAISSHIISFRFLPISRNFGCFFFIISKGKIFRAHRRKILISVITGEPVLATIALFW